ncbi:MAG TPA: hypothetical protein VMF52_00380 [Steroidobacteraceae bacterium]|nr:hypothetical protein [Steroidobacteraceae bacterium]
MRNATVWLDVAPAAHRAGVKGPRAAALLGELGLNVPRVANSWSPLKPADRDDADNVIARLGNTEFFLEDADSATVAALDARCAAGEPGAYAALREDVALHVGGKAAPDALAEVCNVDFAALPAGKPIYLTLMIGVAVLVLPQPREDGRIFRIWCDPTFGTYLQDALHSVVTRIQSETS